MKEFKINICINGDVAIVLLAWIFYLFARGWGRFTLAMLGGQ